MQLHHLNDNSRKLNTMRNFVFSFGFFLLNTLLSFATRTVFIHLLSTEYLGINGLFSGILSILSLAEFGAGGVFVSLLYRPLADHDAEQMTSVMAAFRKAYLIIGCTVGGVGICLIPFLDFFIPKNTIPNIVLIYVLFLCNSVVTYFCADKKALIEADQKGYLITTYSQLAVIVQYALQIVSLLLTRNFVLYLCIQNVCAIGLNIYVVCKVRKMYPFLRKKAKPLTKDLLQDIKQKIAGGFCVHFGGVITVGTDSLVISHFLGLSVLGIYSNYLLIIGIITKLSDMVIGAVRASTSNLIVSSSEDVSYSFFCKLNFLTMNMLGFFGTCLIVLFNPFISMWVGEAHLMNMPLVILAVLVYFTGFRGLQMPISIYRTATGLYYKDRYVSLVEGFANLLISLYLVQSMGLAGVFLGTILSTFLTTFSGSYLIYRYFFHRSLWCYWKAFFQYVFVFMVVGSIVFYIAHLIPCTSWLMFFMMAVTCGSTTLLLYTLIFRKTDEFKYFKKQFIHLLAVRLT